MNNEYRMNIQVDWINTTFQRSNTSATDDDVLTLWISTTRDQDNKFAVGPIPIGKFVSGSEGNLTSPVKTADFTVTDGDSISVWCRIENKASTGIEKAIVDGANIAAKVLGAIAVGEALVAAIAKWRHKGADTTFFELEAAGAAVVAALLTYADEIILPVLEALGITDPDCDGPVFNPPAMMILPVGDLARKTSRNNAARLGIGIPFPIGLWTDATQTSPKACGHAPETTIRLSGTFTWQKNPIIVPGYKVAALSTQPNGTSLFALATDGHVWSKFFPDVQRPGFWSDWFKLGDKPFPSSIVTQDVATVAAISTEPGESTLFAISEDQQIWSNFFPSPQGTWSDWFSLGAPALSPTSGVTAISTRPGGSSLFAMAGNTLQTKFFPDAAQVSGWSPWLTLASNVSPTLRPLFGLSPRLGATSLFAIDGFGKQLWARTFPDPASGTNIWSEWRSLGGLPNDEIMGNATALSTNPGSTSLYVAGGDGQLWAKYFPAEGGGWSNWFTLGGQFALDSSGVAALSIQPGGTSLFGFFSDGNLYTKFFPDPMKNGLWSDWIPLLSATSPHFSMNASISALSTRPGASSLFAVDEDGVLWSRYFPDENSNWSDWFPL